MQQSTNIIFYGLASLNLEKTLTITINMTISAHRVNNDVVRRCNNDETMGTIQPAGKIDVADAKVSIHRSKKCARSWQ